MHRHDDLLWKFEEWGATPETFRHVAGFLNWLGPLPPGGPTPGHVMEFLWGWVPMNLAGPETELEEVRSSLREFLEFLRRQGHEVKKAKKIVYDKRTYLRRIRSYASVPQELWLEELRLALEFDGHKARPDMPWATELNWEDRWENLPRPSIAEADERFRRFQSDMAFCEALRQVGLLLNHLGEGRKGTQKGNLSLADTKAMADRLGCADKFDEQIGDRVFKTKSMTEIYPVHLIYKWARAARLIKIRKDIVSPTASGKALERKPREVWWSLFFALATRLEWPKNLHQPDRIPFWADTVGRLVPGCLRVLHQDREQGVSLEQMAHAAWRYIEDEFVTDDLTDVQINTQISMIEWAFLWGVAEPLEMLSAADVLEEGKFAKLTPLGVAALELLSALNSSRTSCDERPFRPSTASARKIEGMARARASRRVRSPGPGNGIQRAAKRSSSSDT